MAGIFNFFTALLAKITAVLEWLLAVFMQIFKDLFNLIMDLVLFVFDSFLGIAVGAIKAIAIPFDPGTYYSMIPPEVGSVLGYIGIPQAISIIVASLLIRFGLQLIPFVRLGS